MGKKLYVGNLPFSTTEERLKEVFGTHGTVVSVILVSDRETGRPRGFGFIEMDSEESAAKATTALNQTDLDGRNIVVNEAREKSDRPPRMGGNGGSGGYRDKGGNRENRYNR